MEPRIRGFFSYSREDDEADFGNLTRLRAAIERELAMRLGLSGKDVNLFQDSEDLRTGQSWEARLRAAVMEADFFVLLSTPRAFRPESFVRKELAWFLEREKRLPIGGLIIPIAYMPIVGVEQAEDSAVSADLYLSVLRQRQNRRWDHLRHADERDQSLRSAIESLVRDICDALERNKLNSAKSGVRPSPPSAAPRAEMRPTGADSTGTGEPATVTTRALVHAVPEIVVDALGRADCRTIAEAINRATKGERIVVRPGYYQEQLVIERPIEIVGAGARSEVTIVSSSANVIVFNTSFGRIAGLTLHNRSARHYGIDIVQGRLHLDDCDISSRGLACIAVHGGADPMITGCVIHDGPRTGLFIYDGGRGTFEDNEILGNTLAGVEVKEEADPTFRRNRIHDGKASGIFVRSKARGTYEDNDIFANTLAGVEVKHEADPTFRRNRIHDGRESGIFVLLKGRGTYEDNDISGNTGSGIQVADESDPVVRRNHIHSGNDDGLFILDGGKGTFEDNIIEGNRDQAIRRQGSTSPSVGKNTIRDNAGDA
jgi:F-box protein 11